jgi:hypothetical protein
VPCLHCGGSLQKRIRWLGQDLKCAVLDVRRIRHLVLQRESAILKASKTEPGELQSEAQPEAKTDRLCRLLAINRSARIESNRRLFPYCVLRGPLCPPSVGCMPHHSGIEAHVDRVALGVGTVRWNAHVEPMVDKPAGEDPPSVLHAWHASVTSLCSASLSHCMLRALSQASLCEQRNGASAERAKAALK